MISFNIFLNTAPLKKFISTIALCSLIAFCLGLITACGGSAQKAEKMSMQHLQQSQAYKSQGQFRAAIIEARNAIQQDTSNKKANILLAELNIDTGNYNAAITALEKELPTQEANTNTLLVEAYLKRGKYHSALKNLKENQSLNLYTNKKDILYSLFGDAYARLGYTDQALDFYGKSLAQNKNYFNAHKGLAEIYAATNQFHESYKHLATMKTLETNENNNNIDHKIDRLLFEAKLAIHDGNLEKTEQLLTQTLSELPNADILTPRKADILSTLSNVLTKRGKPTQALAYKKILLETFPNAEGVSSDYEEALNIYKKGDMNEATELLLKILDDYPQYQNAKQLLGIIYFLQDNPKSAQNYLQDDFDAEVSASVVNRAYAVTQLKLDQPKKILSEFSSIIDSTKDVDILSLYSIAALSEQEYKKSEKYLLKALELEPKNINIKILASQHYLQTTPAKNALAKKYITDALKIDGQNIRSISTLIKFYIGNNEPEKAENFAAEKAGEFSENLDIQLLAGATYNANKHYFRAQTYYSLATKIDPSNQVALIAYADNQLIQKKYPEAIKAYEKTIKKNPNDINSFVKLLRSYEQINKIQEGISYLDTLDNEASYVAKADYYVRKKNLKALSSTLKSLTKFNQSKTYPKHFSALKYFESRIYAAQKDTPNSLASINEALQQNPNSLALLEHKFSVLVSAKNYSEAENMLQIVGNINKSRENLLTGDFYYAQENFPSAELAYKKSWGDTKQEISAQKLFNTLIKQDKNRAKTFSHEWIKTRPESANALLRRSTFYLEDQNYTNAIKDLEKMLSITQNNAVAYNNLAWAYLKTNNRKAVDAAKKASEIAPSSGEILDTYGWSLLRFGNKKEAINVLEKAVSLSPDNKEIQKHLSEAKQ